VIQLALASTDAVQPQPPPAVIPNSPPPPAAGCDAESALSAKVQACPWVTVNVRPAIVSVPDRSVPSLDAAANRTSPFPLLLSPLPIVSHEALLLAVQAQPPGAVTDTVPPPPDGGTAALDGEIVNVQPWPWLTVNVRPATVRVPVRAGPVVDAARNATLPLPVPFAPLVIVSHDALLDAVHAQPGPVVTPTVPLPPSDGTDCELGEML
jgi:hypothetical protein